MTADRTDGWPVALRGVTETVATTFGPNGRWNAAALGVHAPEGGRGASARTWGRTRTRGNFEREGGGYVQFVRDPVVFADAALGVLERDTPLLDAAAAWVRVTARRTGTGEADGTAWADWRLAPVACEVRDRRVEPLNRGLGAVVEATVAASRLGVRGFEDDQLRARLDWLAAVVERCGGARERTAIDRVAAHTAWERDEPL